MAVVTKCLTEAEVGEQHCQVGNHQIAIDTIIHWLDATC